MRIHFLEHSGFLVELPSTALVFDFFRDPADALADYFRERRARGPAPVPVVFFVSHAHGDHCSRDILRYADDPLVFYVLEERAAAALLDDLPPGKGPPSDAVFRVSPDRTRVLRVGSGSIVVDTFGSTDEGVSYLVQAGDLRFFHAGDLNDWYWEEESTPEELLHDEAAFDAIVERIAARVAALGPLDAAFLPVDARLGRHALRGPLRFLSRVSAASVVPMHLSGGGDLPDLLAAALASSVTSVVAFPGPGRIMEA